MPETNLARAIEPLRVILGAAGDVLAGQGDWRRALLRYRQDLAATIPQAAAAARQIPCAQRADELRRRIEHFRTAAALHQAEWPVVTIDLEDTSYQTSARNVLRLGREFLALIDRS